MSTCRMHRSRSLTLGLFAAGFFTAEAQSPQRKTLLTSPERSEGVVRTYTQPAHFVRGSSRTIPVQLCVLCASAVNPASIPEHPERVNRVRPRAVVDRPQVRVHA